MRESVRSALQRVDSQFGPLLKPANRDQYAVAVEQLQKMVNVQVSLSSGQVSMLAFFLQKFIQENNDKLLLQIATWLNTCHE